MTDLKVFSLLMRETRQGVTLNVRVQARARKTAITGVFGEGVEAAIKIALAAPPIAGRANDLLIEFLSAIFDVPRSSVEIVSGMQSRNKVLRVASRTAAEISSRLSELVPDLRSL